MDASADTTMLPAASAPAESAPPEAATTPAFAEHIERIRAHRAGRRGPVGARRDQERREEDEARHRPFCRMYSSQAAATSAMVALVIDRLAPRYVAHAAAVSPHTGLTPWIG